ncbi:MAG: hypothetical protein FWJ62_05765 [Thermaerobacter sp.]|nr:hypothetical protein [Bacillota bacterium]REJ38267.1 MAG: hypothetical protein DIU84_00885 [Bacillota bacterium]
MLLGPRLKLGRRRLWPAQPLLGLGLFVAGILLVLAAAPGWLWRAGIGLAAAWWGWKLFTER